MNNQVPLEYLFFGNFMVGRPAECWPWLGVTSITGYGRIRGNGINHYAHRLSYELHKGEIGDGLVVRHTCDNPRCVNPNHLLLGTYAENTADMLTRGRHVKGAAYRAEIQRSRPHCQKGHLYSEVGILWQRGGRICRECARLKSARNNARVRGKQAA